MNNTAERRLQEFRHVSNVLADMAEALESKSRRVLTPFSDLLDDAGVYDGLVKSEHDFYGVVNEAWMIEQTSVAVRNVMEELDFVKSRLNLLLQYVDKLA